MTSYCMIRRMSGWFVCSTAMVIVGCGDSGPAKLNVVPVSGKVVYKNQPLEGATVSFWGDGSARPAVGLTDAEGKFQLATYTAGDGAVAGDHKVTVVKEIASGDASWIKDESMDEAAARGDNIPQPPKAVKLIPDKYSKPETSGLVISVAPGGSRDITIEIKD